MTRIRVATRGSDLALAQSGTVAEAIARALGVRTELVVVKTEGDRLQHVSLAKVGGKGLFIKEIEEALLAGRADVAVHSAKDLPSGETPGLVLAAIPIRADCRDALVARAPGTKLADLRRGARVGTGSVRRGALLRAGRPDLEVVPLRGNVPTRLRKLDDEGLDAVVLACAGLERLGLAERIDERIATEVMLPAVGQGSLAVQARAGESLATDLLALDDPTTRAALLGERAFLARLEGDCTVPLAAFAMPLEGGRFLLRGLLTNVDGSKVVRAEAECSAGGIQQAGEELADRVLESGGREILRTLAEDAS